MPASDLRMHSVAIAKSWKLYPKQVKLTSYCSNFFEFTV